ncbi:hypothetical protein PR202_gb00130 [Eleusine coracana subsp. coracana]|uniref:Serine aminopeptidase S33 domain-containing protein n=1 Tax=Eleusine coracana subsp. coracana TaxID=191504 RepID=A0AAV5DSE2_ELECO|nr:hypothetical protein PR202_gb00130 [Eleusine coracana subsp. coracana]
MVRIRIFAAEVPVVDLSRLLRNESVEEEASKLKFACGEWGFVQVAAECSISMREKSENKGKKACTAASPWAEAWPFLLHRKAPDYWDGAVLVAPMCKVRSNPYIYRGKFPLKTCHELPHGQPRHGEEFGSGNTAVLGPPRGRRHRDRPSVSKLLFEKASSRDKTFKLYPGMWHALTAELPSDVERVYSDIISC